MHMLERLEYNQLEKRIKHYGRIYKTSGQFPNSTCTRTNQAAGVLDIVLSSQNEFVDNVVIQEPLGISDHNQLHYNINIKSDKTKVNNVGGILGKVTIGKLGKV